MHSKIPNQTGNKLSLRTIVKTSIYDARNSATETITMEYTNHTSKSRPNQSLLDLI
jgi:hypothetical protein